MRRALARAGRSKQAERMPGAVCGDENSMTERGTGLERAEHFPCNLRQVVQRAGLKAQPLRHARRSVQTAEHLIRGRPQVLHLNHRTSPPFNMISSFLRARERRLEIVPSGRFNIAAISAMPNP